LKRALEAPRAPVRDSVPRPGPAESLAIVGREQELEKLSGYGIRHNGAQSEYRLARRKLDRAEEHARALLANAQQNSVAKYVAVARRLVGEIAAVRGDVTTAEEELTRSFEPFATHPMPLIEWRNHAALGRLLAARNRPGAQAKPSDEPKR
jgi:hypothetical protein